MRHPRRDANDVSGDELAPKAALNRAVAFFMRRDSFAIQQRSANDQRRRAGLHEEDVGLSLVPFGLAVRFPVNQQETFVGILGELFHGKVVRIGGRIGAQRLRDMT